MTGTLDDSAVISGLRAGDESTFVALVDAYTPVMLRVARGYVPSREVAEDVLQDTWIAVIKGIDRFEGRSSLRTWIFAVMINIAKTRGVRERREVDTAAALEGPASVDPARFRPSGQRWAGHWKEEQAPSAFPDSPEGSLLGGELVAVAQAELERLPHAQRSVVTLRDMLGFDSAEVCTLLDITAANQRVLLHRGRAKLRAVLEEYLADTP